MNFKGRRPKLEFIYNAINTNTENCIVMPFRATETGYIQVRYKGKIIGAHRLSLALFLGNFELNEVLHNCDIRACVNPTHLRNGSHSDNMKDMVARNRQNLPFGSNHPNSKLTEEDIPKIRELLKTTTMVNIAKQFNVDRKTITKIRDNKTWSQVC